MNNKTIKETHSREKLLVDYSAVLMLECQLDYLPKIFEEKFFKCKLQINESIFLSVFLLVQGLFQGGSREGFLPPPPTLELAFPTIDLLLHPPPPPLDFGIRHLLPLEQNLEINSIVSRINYMLYVCASLICRATAQCSPKQNKIQGLTGGHG